MIAILFGMTLVITLVWFFNNAQQLATIPPVTPDAFLASMPHSSISLWNREYVLIQPSSTLFVYLLGILMFLLGVYFLISTGKQLSRKYWGIGLILWGLGAITAGTSYQAFGYELKCKGFEICRFTSSFELIYMLLTAYSINFLVAATGYTSLGQTGRRRTLWFAIIDSVLFSLFMFIGAIEPVRFMVSYEGFMAFMGGNFMLMFILNLRHTLLHKDHLNRRLVFIWISFLLVNLGYFAFLLGGFGSALYQNYGIWFNENDALHVLLILWALQIFLTLRKDLKDLVLN